MQYIRINDLARELDAKSRTILEVLLKVGVTEKKTYSSSLTEEQAELVKKYLAEHGEPPKSPPGPSVVTPKGPVREGITSTEVAIHARDDELAFMQNEKLREIATRDFSELRKVKAAGAHKARIVFVCALLEGVLLDTLLTLGEKVQKTWTAAGIEQKLNGRHKKLSQWNLFDLIKAATELKVIKNKSVEQYSHQVRSFRNLIHPGFAMEDDPIREEDANIAEEILRIVIADLRDGGRKSSKGTN
jgi:hypothetical protein